MLTGESVPVSKIPVKDEDLARWRETSDVQGDMARSFLFAGTKVVRIRKSVGQAESPYDRPVARSNKRLKTFVRVHDDEGRARAFYALPKANRVQVLPRLDSIHYRTFWNRWVWFLC
jgi:hypothetical protein